jgi:hypothetical protein
VQCPRVGGLQPGAGQAAARKVMALGDAEKCVSLQVHRRLDSEPRHGPCHRVVAVFKMPHVGQNSRFYSRVARLTR